VIGRAFDRYAPAFYPNYPFNYTDRDALGVEDGTLLDVKFEKSRDVTRTQNRGVQLCWVAPKEFDAFSYGFPGMSRELEIVFGHRTDHGAAAGLAGFLIFEDDNFEGMSSGNSTFLEYLRHLDSSKHAQLSVEVATIWYRVAMGSEHQWGQDRISSIAPAEYVPGGVNVDVEPGVAHQLHQKLSTVPVGLTECDAVAAAVGEFTELRQRLEA